ncbi:hypothetical protein [Meiothermus hypogaeus]|uniref:Uncharacterized protein n=2 Tax=Meiothermus hypogaeus TaxID=884155 RepID=A0A511R419_9DEIN|nr:hypothetical protein [Meiothermus hypogaeus]RIH80573.1 hypothetical protein Mhypo_00491 [Meiothermus hypogaeus]GEM84037.1 hypothetical protein MHY01S_22030 [Meiothermus hypogaeus NBRC 106114]
MKRWFAILALWSVAWAAPAITLYDQLAPTLDQVRSLQNSNPARALELLSKAEDDFRKGAGDLAPVLRDGILQSLSDARQALARRSNTDLEARIQIIKAIMGKALYDNYFSALTAGNSADASRLLPKVLSASGLPNSLQAQAQTLAAANNLDGLRRLFERTYAQGITNALQRAQAQTSAVQAYLEATRAYALYLIVQDSPRARGLTAKGFVDALGKLSSGNLNLFKTDVQGLISQAQNFLKAASAPQSQRRSNPTTTAQNPPAAGGVRLEAPRTPPAPREVTPARAAAAQPPAKPAARPVAPVTPKPAPAPRPVQAAAPIPTDAYQQLLADLRFLIRDSRKVERIADSLSGAGIYSIDDWKRALLEVRGRLLEAQAQAETGQSDTARRTLAQVNARYKTAIEPLVEALRPELAQRTSRVFALAENAVGLRTSDFTVLSGELLENGLALEGQSLGTFHDVQVWLLQTILGIPRAFLFILAGMLAFFPLYLLTLTFGGRNMYWRFLGLAFFFLLLPAMMEGLSYIGSILSDSRYGRLPFLGVLTNLSIQQNLVAQLFWGLTVFLVIIFATIGLRGIAAQFGLLQNQRTPLRRSRNPTVPQTAAAATAASTAAKPNPGLTSETIVEWDEEF